MARHRRRRNPGIGAGTVALLGGVGAYFLIPSVKTAIDGVFAGVGGGGGMTEDQACIAARTALAALDGSWASKDCAAIKTKVCSDRTLFVSASGTDAQIRKAFSCPLS
jgi:hypothetical protein